MRAAVNTLFANGGGNDGLSLFWPYFPDADAAWESHETLEKRRQELGPAHEAKLKAARLKHIEEMKKRGR